MLNLKKIVKTMVQLTKYQKVNYILGQNLVFLRMGFRFDRTNTPPPPLSKGQRYILVARNYFTKLVESIPLKDVDQNDIINFIKQNIIF